MAENMLITAVKKQQGDHVKLCVRTQQNAYSTEQQDHCENLGQTAGIVLTQLKFTDKFQQLFFLLEFVAVK